jgi:hypothetical protein
VEGGTLHRTIVREGDARIYLDEEDLARVQDMMYYCDDCLAYHLRDASANMGEFVRRLNEEVESA